MLYEFRAAEDGGRRDGRWWRIRRRRRRRDERVQHCGTPAVCLLHICSRLIVCVWAADSSGMNSAAYKKKKDCVTKG